MKIKCYHNRKTVSISAESFSVNQINSILDLPRRNQERVEHYNNRLSYYEECEIKYLDEARDIINNIELLRERYLKVRDVLHNDRVFPMYAVTEFLSEKFGFLFEKKFTYEEYDPFFDSHCDTIVLKDNPTTRMLSKRVNEIGREITKLKDSEKIIKKKCLPLGYPGNTPKKISLELKLGNRLVCVWESHNTKEDLLKALDHKNKKQAIIAKAASLDGTQRQAAMSVKNDIKTQFKILSNCPYCGKLFDSKGAHADHIYPISKGGLSTVKNMVYVCCQCNKNKSDMTLRTFLIKYNLPEDKAHDALIVLGKDF